MNNKLISEADLDKNIHIVKSDLSNVKQGAIEFSDYGYGRAFLYYTLFDNPSFLPSIGIKDLSVDFIFYNKYYWFLLFIKLYQKKHGYDAGLEQLAFKLLESADYDFSLDWAIVEWVSNQVDLALDRADN